MGRRDQPPGRSLRTALGLWLATVATATAGAEPEVDYSRDIRPVLSRNCFACHGPDEKHRGSGLRLDRREAAISDRGGYAAIVPGDPEASELVFRITEEDEAVRMPPKKAGGRLGPSEIALLRRWIEQGAAYTEHWAFVPPRRRPLPEVQGRAWPVNAIDHWILDRLEREGLRPAAKADPYTLLRRVSLDLRGLPPSPEEIDAFMGDPSPDAYEKAVDRFVADPAFGERWARMWLDLARYADSAGYGSDPLRPGMWRYRDWVVDALNDNLPYDRFTVEQLAGDLLPGSSFESRVATAFHRNSMTNAEGGDDDEEFRVAAVKDRTDTTAQVWMGLTLGCAKCHTHKYDPISQEEYYRFYAFFDQTSDSDKDDDSPTMPVSTPAMDEQARRVDARIAELEAEFDVATPELDAAQVAWEAGLRREVEWVPLDALASSQTESGACLEALPDRSIRVEGENPATDVYTILATIDDPEGIVAVRLEAIPDPSLPEGGSGRGPDGRFAMTGFAVEIAPEVPGSTDPTANSTSSGPRPIALGRALADFSQEGFRVADTIDNSVYPKTGWAVGPRQGERHQVVFEFKEPLAGAGPARVSFRLEHRSSSAGHNLGRFRISLTRNPMAIRRAEVPPAILTVLDTPAERRTPEGRKALAAHYRSIAPAFRAVRDAISALEKSRPKIPALPVMVELPRDRRRTSRILNKGNFLDPGEVVEPGVPMFLHPLPDGAPRDRRGLALWLVDPRNPLTARVAVNRIWAGVFGVGLVETEEDFGTQGEPPSHPELLDWLAVEYLRLGWDTKALLRQIVTSATYRQASRVTPELLARDPHNRLLARAPRHRLEAEMIRDQALALGGLLSRKLHGPSVFPPQPEGLWQAAFNGQRTWMTSDGVDRYRRALYTFWRRTVPYPSMATFDAPSREVCAIRRTRTSTPLQALVTLNDPVYVEAAQALARRIVREGGTTVEDRVRFGLRLCLGRPPEARQVEVLVALFEGRRDRYRGDPDAALALATDPLGPLPPGTDAAELAAWTTVANVLLNLDGVLTKG
jgi:hypothetical protein